MKNKANCFGGALKLIFACSGAADVGAVADEANISKGAELLA